MSTLRSFAGRADCTLTNTTIDASYDPAGGLLYEIPVVWHVVSRANGRGNLARSVIESQMEVLNEDFNALPGTPGANGKDARVRFYLATLDPDGNPTNGIDRVVSTAWFEEFPDLVPPIFSFFPALAWDTSRYLNVYTKELPVDVRGVARLPQEGVVGTPDDWVVLSYEVVGRNARFGPPFDQGRTATHQVGHWAGLIHPFAGGCTAADCYRSGDLVCDTGTQSLPLFGCPVGSTTCGTPDPVTNYMGFVDDACMQTFTDEQVNRMRCSLANWRPDVHRPLCAVPAGLAMRAAPPNPDALGATVARLGEVLTVTVDTRPYDFGLVVVSAAPASLPLPSGQVLLVDLTSAPVCATGPLAGPDATFARRVPYDPALCGLAVSAQAVLFGGRAPFALTNAIDFVIGG